MTKRYTIAEAVLATGLDEARLRFCAKVFREFLPTGQAGLGITGYSEVQVQVLRRVKELLAERGLPLDEVRRQLREALPNRIAEVGPEAIGYRPRARAPSNGAPKRSARVLAVTSGKGGVGKTTVAVNLSLAFAEAGHKVALFDADLGMANVHILMGIRPQLNVRHVIEEEMSLEDVICQGPLGVKILCGGQGVRALANLTPDRRRMLLRQLEVLEREVDILLIDTGGGMSEDVLQFISFADEVVLVTTPELTAASDGYSIVKVLLEIEPASRIGVVANMVPSMYHARNVYNRINAAATKYLKTQLGDLGYVVEDRHVKASVKNRKPFKLAHPDCEASRCIDSIAETILHGEIFRNKRKPSGFSGLMGKLKRQLAGVS